MKRTNRQQLLRLLRRQHLKLPATKAEHLKLLATKAELLKLATKAEVPAVAAAKAGPVVDVEKVAREGRAVLAAAPADLAAASASFSARRKSASSVSRRSI